MPTATLEEARAAFDSGRFEDALRLLGEIHDSGQLSPKSVRLAQDAFMRMGELHRALGELNRLRVLDPSPNLDLAARRLMGRIIETDPDWLPAVRAPRTTFPAETNEQKRRVLHILKESIPYSETGFTMRSRMTLAAQRLAGFEPEVVTSLGFPRTKGVTDHPETQLLDGVRHHHLDPGPEVDVRSLPWDVVLTRTAEMTARIADEFGPDLIQAGTGYRGYETALVGISLAERYDIPFVYEVRGFQEQTWTSDIARSEKGEYYRRRYAQENRCMHRADAVVTIAHAMAREIIERGIPEEKVSVVPNAVDIDRFTPREKRDDLIDRYGLRDRFVIGYISNLGAREGIDNLIRAVGLLRAQHQDIACLIAGDGPEAPRLRELVDALELEDFVRLVGHIPNAEIEDHYALIDLFVVPRIDDRASRYVTPLKPLEAMSMGLPVIVSALPALEELVDPGTRGLSFPPADPAGLAEAVNTLMTDTATRRRFAEAGRAWVLEDRALGSNADRYGKILSPLIQ